MEVKGHQQWYVRVDVNSGYNRIKFENSHYSSARINAAFILYCLCMMHTMEENGTL